MLISMEPATNVPPAIMSGRLIIVYLKRNKFKIIYYEGNNSKNQIGI